jgi:F-type H+-transporting ATPase subunit epsilon
MTLTVRVLAPDRQVWDSTAEELILPSTTGQLGILTGHAPLLTALETGVMRVRTDKTWIPVALMGGFAEVENNEVTILVNGGELGESINLDDAKAEYAKAESELQTAQSSADKQEIFQATQAYKRARARLQAAGGSVSVG